MRRLLIVYNPRSSRFEDVKNEVITPATKLSGFMVGKYEIKKTNFDDNKKTLAALIQDGDLVIAAGGDATSAIAANAIMESGRDVTLAALPYGNFNDLSRTLGTANFSSLFSHGASESKLYPLEITVDGELFRFATCYITLGMTASAVKIFDSKSSRRLLKSAIGPRIGSYFKLAGWYFKNRFKNPYLKEFTINGKPVHKKSSDYFAVNGKYLARVMKNDGDFTKPKSFKSTTARLTNFWCLFSFMMNSIFETVPGTKTSSDTLNFINPSTVELQAEGESRIFNDVTNIEIKKSARPLKVITA